MEFNHNKQQSGNERQKTQHSSFKRPTPVMGNRGLETRNSKRSPHPSKSIEHRQHTSTVQQMTVGALEVMNVKRAINRYGTLPKVARIGAYLESLEQNDIDSNQASNSLNQETVPPPPPPPILADANGILSRNHSGYKTQPQMIRSNSSSGVTMANNATASLNKLQRHRTTADGTMITFSSFRATSNSPKRSQQPTLADLEFPPPPLDLPPPPEDFEYKPDADQYSDKSMLPASSTTFPPPTPVNDVSNTAPSVEEASSRFGVSLKKREPSTDSCSSLGTPPESCDPNKLEMKLMAEIKERTEQKRENTKTISDANKEHDNSVDPVSQLVSELAESMNLSKQEKDSRKCQSAMANNSSLNSALVQNTASFKAQLKKVEPKKFSHSQNEFNAIIDFKSRLRKVDNNHESQQESDDMSNRSCDKDNQCYNKKQNECSDNKRKAQLPQKELKKTEIKIDIIQTQEKSRENIAGSSLKIDSSEEDNKRRSTGSISSLKKLWEAKEVPAESQSQLSPKLGLKSNNSKTVSISEDGSEVNTILDDCQSSNKKPAIPLKPTKLTIYATPMTQKITQNSDANVNSNQNSISQTTTNLSGSTPPSNREGILELVSLLEINLKIPINSITASQWLQLSDRLNILQNSCVVFAENESMPPHLKFHFRELINRVETQSRSLRSAGNKNVQDNERLVSEINQSLKQISNALHR